MSFLNNEHIHLIVSTVNSSVIVRTSLVMVQRRQLVHSLVMVQMSPFFSHRKNSPVTRLSLPVSIAVLQSTETRLACVQSRLDTSILTVARDPVQQFVACYVENNRKCVHHVNRATNSAHVLRKQDAMCDCIPMAAYRVVYCFMPSDPLSLNEHDLGFWRCLFRRLSTSIPHVHGCRTLCNAE